MTRFYIMTQPFRMSPTGVIYLAQHINNFFPSAKYYPLAKHDDNFTEFGYIEGSGNTLSNALEFCSKSFNVERLFEDEFVGAMALYRGDRVDPETEEVVETLTEFLNRHSISFIDDGSGNVAKVYHAKKFKYKEFKAIAKNEFTDYNDLIANLSKTLLLLQEYSGALTSDQQTRLDNCITNMKNIYDVDTCLNALEDDLALIQSIMPDYYTAKQNVASKTTLEDVKNSVYK